MVEICSSPLLMREYNYNRRPHGNPRVERKVFALKMTFLFLCGMALAGYIVYLAIVK